MRTPIRGAIAATFLLIFAIAGPMGAETVGGYDLSWSSVDGGGSVFATGGAYSLGATIGQPDAGSAAGGPYALSSGFWNDDQTRVFVPRVLR